MVSAREQRAIALVLRENQTRRSGNMSKYEKHYSGKSSRAFWVAINGIPPRYWKAHGKLYSLGVELQNLEERVLKELETVEDRINGQGNAPRRKPIKRSRQRT